MGNSERNYGTEEGGDSAATRLAREVSSLQATLLGKLHEEMPGGDSAAFAAAAQELAEDFGSVTAAAVGAVWGRREPSGPTGAQRA